MNTTIFGIEGVPNIILKLGSGMSEILKDGSCGIFLENCPHSLGFKIKSCKKNLSTISIIYPHSLFKLV